MSTRDRIALALPPIFLRIGLATVFIWAGLGKVMAPAEFSGQQAAILANMGVIKPAPSHTTPILPPPDADTPDDTDAPDDPPADPREDPENPPSHASLDHNPADNTNASGFVPLLQTAPLAANPPYTAADFPNAVKKPMLFHLAVAIYTAANPGLNDDGSPKRALWPAGLAKGRWPVYLAYAVVVAELLGGAMVLLGLLTRLWALSLAGVMVGAIWLTQVGPAMQSGKAVWGFLPNYPAFGMEWQTPMLQLTLLLMALALTFAGAGALALDNAIFGSSAAGADADDDDDE